MSLLLMSSRWKGRFGVMAHFLKYRAWYFGIGSSPWAMPAGVCFVVGMLSSLHSVTVEGIGGVIVVGKSSSKGLSRLCSANNSSGL